MTSEAASPTLRTEAIEALLVEKGLVESAAVDALVERYEQDVGPLRGAQAVARAWTDSAFRARLLADGMPAVRELGFGDRMDGHVARLVVKENTDTVHNLVVCTLCSCYPWAVLGLPPAWYKSPAYRSRAVREPRRLLAELGLDLPGRRRGAGLGLERGGALHGPAAAAAGERRPRAGRTGRPGHARLDDRRRASLTRTLLLDSR